MTSENETSKKLDLILSQLQALSHRVDSLEHSRNTIVDNLDKACGVDPSQIQRNQLMGENAKKLASPFTAEQTAARKRKQALGARLYTVYCIGFMVLMVLSYKDLLPVFAVESSFTEEQLTETARFMGYTMHIPVILSVVYVFTIFGIQHVLSGSAPFDLRMPLALWSLFLGVFSIAGSLRTVPALLKLIQNNGVTGVICGDTRQEWLFNHPAGIWTGVFILSKVPELIDTLFIVLRKRPLITLHWYHHITVMLYCWHSWATYSQSGIFFAAMNLTVHAFMYIFYFLAALGYRPTAFAKYVTIIQILQMFAGTAITGYIVYHMTFVVPQPMMEKAFSMEWNVDVTKHVDNSPKCKINPGNALAGLAMYASYLWLFCVFFYYAYLAPRKPRGDALEKKTN